MRFLDCREKALILQDYIQNETIILNLEGMKTALVTGANGFVGSYLIKELNGYSVIGLVKDGNPANSENVQYVSGDITNPENVFQILSEHKPEFIFHLAGIAQPGLKIPDFYLMLTFLELSIFMRQ